MQYGHAMLRSYFTQLEEMAEASEADLLACFIAAGVADSTFYRCRSGKHDLHFATARKVAEILGKTERTTTRA